MTRSQNIDGEIAKYSLDLFSVSKMLYKIRNVCFCYAVLMYTCILVLAAAFERLCLFIESNSANN